MKFEVSTGTKTLTWDEGKITGTTSALITLATKAASLEGTPVGYPTAPLSYADHLFYPLTAKYLMFEVLGQDAEFSGDNPPMPEPPKGAIP